MNIIKVLLAIPLLYSCIEAASNGRGNKDPGPRQGENEACSAGDTSRQCATTYDAFMVSHIYRSKNSEQLTYYDENSLIVKGELPTTYRVQVDPSRDNDEAMDRLNFDMDAGEYGQVDCGGATTDDPNKTYSSIKNRIKSCFAQHETKENGKSIWNGQESGQSGEGQWKMVLGENLEDTDTDNDVIWWRDMRTGLVWSHALNNEEWQYASGLYDRDDDNNVGKSFGCENLHKYTKTEEDPNGQIAWRLPNRNEFLQADLNGARSIFHSSSDEFWTASTGRIQAEAWVIKQSTGELKKANKDNAYKVRCVGVVIK